MRLIYSADDNGWYWEDENWRTSQVFGTREDAIKARKQGELRWDA